MINKSLILYAFSSSPNLKVHCKYDSIYCLIKVFPHGVFCYVFRCWSRRGHSLGCTWRSYLEKRSSHPSGPPILHSKCSHLPRFILDTKCVVLIYAPFLFVLLQKFSNIHHWKCIIGDVLWPSDFFFIIFFFSLSRSLE